MIIDLLKDCELSKQGYLMKHFCDDEGNYSGFLAAGNRGSKLVFGLFEKDFSDKATELFAQNFHIVDLHITPGI